MEAYDRKRHRALLRLMRAHAPLPRAHFAAAGAVVGSLPSNPRAVHRSTATIEVLYQAYQGAVPVIVGKALVSKPPRVAVGSTDG